MPDNLKETVDEIHQIRSRCKNLGDQYQNLLPCLRDLMTEFRLAKPKWRVTKDKFIRQALQMSPSHVYKLFDIGQWITAYVKCQGIALASLPGIGTCMELKLARCRFGKDDGSYRNFVRKAIEEGLSKKEIKKFVNDHDGAERKIMPDQDIIPIPKCFANLRAAQESLENLDIDRLDEETQELLVTRLEEMKSELNSCLDRVGRRNKHEDDSAESDSCGSTSNRDTSIHRLLSRIGELNSTHVERLRGWAEYTEDGRSNPCSVKS